MLVACVSLVSTLKILQVATAIGVTGACPADVQINNAAAGSVLDFSQATATRLDIVNINGLTIENFSSNAAPYSALNVINSTNILLNQPHIISPGSAGITIQGSDTVEVAGMWVEQSSGDGIDVAGSTNINVHDGSCDANVPTAIHPDCTQMWSVTGYPMQHIIVQNMMVTGDTQGFDLWDHTDFGATDIQLINNTAALTYSNCIGAWNTVDLVVSGNLCQTLPGANGPAGLNIMSSPDAIITNNTLGAPRAPKILQ